MIVIGDYDNRDHHWSLDKNDIILKAKETIIQNNCVDAKTLTQTHNIAVNRATICGGKLRYIIECMDMYLASAIYREILDNKL